MVERDEQKRVPHPDFRAAMAVVLLVGGVGFIVAGLGGGTLWYFFPGILFLVNSPAWFWRSRRNRARRGTGAASSS